MTDAPPLDDLFLAFQQAVAGRYFIDREIGRGGMGVVYLAREVQLDRMVAIKLLPPEFAWRDDLRARFINEARLAARLTHPHIVPIHAVDETGDFVYFVMALVDGVTLAQRVRTRGPVSASEGTRVLREVALALAHAHGQGVVHRDVKPDNILLDRATGRALVADFGIAAVLAAPAESGAALPVVVSGAHATIGNAGTPAFMSPEQILGNPADARSDIYSFGVTAYFALSGRLPFEGASTVELLARQVHDAPPPLLSLGVAVPRRLAHLVDRCLAKDPSERPASAQAVAEQLSVALEQRREVPAVLRGFVKRTGRTSDPQSILALTAISGASVGLSYLVGPIAGFTALIGGNLIAQSAFLAAGARHLLELGFDQGDVRPAFAAELAASSEEYAVTSEAGYRRVASAARAVGRVAATFVTGTGAVAAFYTWVAGPGHHVARQTAQLVWPVIAVAATVGAGAFWVDWSLRRLRGDVDTRFWAALWNGRIGSSMFAIARRLRRGAPVVSAVTHRATELSLGMAAEQLYESLPKPARRALRDLPALLRRLQSDAQALRGRLDALNEALSDADAAAAPLISDAGHPPAVVGQPSAGVGLSSTGVAQSSALAEPPSPGERVRTELRAERDAMQGRMRDAVGALETIRLNLLRLHAGQASVDALTTQISAGNALSDDVRRLIAAREDVDAVFRTPRSVPPSPG